MEPPILDFSLDQPQQEEQNQVGKVSQEGEGNFGATHSRLLEPPILDFSLDLPQQEEQNQVAS